MKTAFRVVPYAHPRLKWVVRGKVDGKYQRRYFEKRVEAETFAKIKNIEFANQGMEGAAFPTALRVMAQRGSDLLEPFGKTINDAVDFYLKHLQAVTRSVPLAQAVSELVKNRALSGVSKRYCQDLRSRLGRFCKDFSTRTASEISTREADDWLAALGLSPVTRNTFRRDLRTLFSFCLTRKYCVENPIVGTSRAKEIEDEIGILHVEEIVFLLNAASVETLPYWAIGAFAGLRRAEIMRLEWSEVDFDSGLIEVKARISKTASRRLVKIQPNLALWLEPYRAETGFVCPNDLQRRIIEDRQRAGLNRCWPSNALRHSYGSYHLAEFKDAAALALQMGNSPAMIFKHYRELVKPKEAARYWQIKPEEADNKNVLSFAG